MVIVGLLVFLTACQGPTVESGTPLSAPQSAPLQFQPTEQSVLSPREFSTEIDIVGRSFSPEEITVSPGTTVRWINRDNMTHAPAGEDFSASERERGEWFEHTFTRPGTYGYTCRLHPGMEGTVIVK